MCFIKKRNCIKIIKREDRVPDPVCTPGRVLGRGSSQRWRLETNTFHVPVGEMTITLQDVAIILGLCIHGLVVIRTCVLYVAELCREMLDVIPPVGALKGSAISIRWLCDQLSTPALDANEVTLEQSARGFILALIGSFLFANKKGVYVHLCFLPLLRDLTQTTAYS